MCIMPPDKGYFPWISSLVLKPKGLALFEKASEKYVEFWEQISTRLASHYGKQMLQGRNEGRRLRRISNMVAVQRYHNQRHTMFFTQTQRRDPFFLFLMETQHSLIFKTAPLNQNDSTSLDTVSERKLISTTSHWHNVLERDGIPFEFFTTPVPKLTVISSSLWNKPLCFKTLHYSYQWQKFYKYFTRTFQSQAWKLNHFVIKREKNSVHEYLKDVKHTTIRSRIKFWCCSLVRLMRFPVLMCFGNFPVIIL